MQTSNLEEDKDGYDEMEQFKDLTIIQSKTYQRITTTGNTATDHVFEKRLEAARSKLSKNECRVFDGVLEGKSFGELAVKLSMPKRSVRRHWESIKRKLQ